MGVVDVRGAVAGSCIILRERIMYRHPKVDYSIEHLDISS